MHQILVLGCRDQDPRSSCGCFPYDLEDLRPRADVHSPNRIVQQEDRRPGLGPLTYEDLLLVATAQSSERSIRVSRADVKCFYDRGHSVAFATPTEEPPGEVLAESGERQV